MFIYHDGISCKLVGVYYSSHGLVWIDFPVIDLFKVYIGANVDSIVDC